jgi:nicotinamide riboside kinase
MKNSEMYQQTLLLLLPSSAEYDDDGEREMKRGKQQAQAEKSSKSSMAKVNEGEKLYFTHRER